ncbi:MAG: XrtA/PEP-CTERM system-associated ATPase [Gammaproteobacteria bacterium]
MYESFYKLKDKPFGLSPNPKMFFSSHSHKRALSYLLYGVKQGDGFIVITGDVGTGKTTLVGALEAMLEGYNIVVGRIVSTQVEAEDLLRVAAAEFGLAYKSESKAVLLKSLEEFFRECAQQGKRVLLLVDEAQNLPPRSVEELRMLSNFQHNGRPLVQSFLLGQKEFRVLLRSPRFVQVRQRVIAAYHLIPLDTEETRAYIEHRLRLVGWNQDPVFAQEAFPLIHRITQGVPRKINMLCDRILLFGCLEEKHLVNAEVLTAVTDDLSQEDLLMGADDQSAREVTGDARVLALRSDLGNANEEGRIAVLETSLQTLGSMVKRELSMLRKAILDTQTSRLKTDPVPMETRLQKVQTRAEKE